MFRSSESAEAIRCLGKNFQIRREWKPGTGFRFRWKDWTYFRWKPSLPDRKKEREPKDSWLLRMISGADLADAGWKDMRSTWEKPFLPEVLRLPESARCRKKVHVWRAVFRAASAEPICMVFLIRRRFPENWWNF